MLLRAMILMLVLAAGQFTVDHIKRGYTLGQVVPPSRDLDQMPMELGSWSGKDVPTDERIQQYLQAKAGINRLYRNAIGEEVSAHVVWTDDYIKVHFPEQCYKEAGWRQTASKSLDIETNEDSAAALGTETASEDLLIEAEGQTFPAKLLTFERDGRQTMVLYWFQMGDRFFFDRVRHRMLRREVCWGNREWPPLVKVMLESPRMGKRSENQLQEVAKQIFSWMNSSS